MTVNRASARYEGFGKEGRGSITTRSGVLEKQPYGFGTRFEGKPGTNPEELIAAAHAACFTMALSFGLARAGYTNIRFRVGDGRLGWPEAAPFPAIVVTAAAESVPDSLVDQLAPGGRMILPVGRTNGPQNLIRIRRDETGRISKDTILSVAFVPLVGGD